MRNRPQTLRLIAAMAGLLLAIIAVNLAGQIATAHIAASLGS